MWSRCTPTLVRVGKTSITVHLEAWVMRRKEMQFILVTDGNYTYVAIDDQGHPQQIPQGEPTRFTTLTACCS